MKEGVQNRIEPQKKPLEPSDTKKNYLQALGNHLRASQYISLPLPFCLRAPHFDLRLLLFLFVYLYWLGGHPAYQEAPEVISREQATLHPLNAQSLIIN